MEFIKELISDPTQLVVYLTAIVGAAAALAKAIELITGITASKKDDEYASKFTKAVASVKGVLDKIGLNPKQ